MMEVKNYIRVSVFGFFFLALFPVLLTAGESSFSSTIGSLGSTLGKKIGLVPAKKANRTGRRRQIKSPVVHIVALAANKK